MSNPRHPVDTEATRALIAKIKKGDAANAAAIVELSEKIGDAISFTDFDVFNESDEIVIKRVSL